ncbi:hypothetical protein GGI05_001020 [Coemansia sp. RSA 2603]|nr:hypothetical protein GGI05_001020 [Coemansia sp. RSA 2603]
MREVEGAEGVAGVEVVEETRAYSVPEHWHVFPSAVVTPRDLMVASGDARVRMAAASSESDDSDGDSEDDSDSDSEDDSDLDSREPSDKEDEEDEELVRELVETNIDGAAPSEAANQH